MAKKGVVISLAAKCQLLFGLAVLVIIAGALAVPWQRMEQLTGREPVHDARTAASDALLYLHVYAGKRAAGAATPAKLFPLRGWKRAGLFHLFYKPPRILPLVGPDAVKTGKDAVTRDALSLFRHRPRETEFGRVEILPGKLRIYRYAAAVRASVSCLRCHAAWRPLFTRHPAFGTPGAHAGVIGPPIQTAQNNAISNAPVAPAPTGPALVAPVPGADNTLTTQAIRPPSAPPAPISKPPVAVELAAHLPVKPAAGPGVLSRKARPLVAMIRIDMPVRIDAGQLILNRIVIVVAGMLGLTLAVVVFYLITNRLILQPVRVLRNTAEKVRRGDLNIRSAISTGDEFEQLSDTFNGMLVTLQASQDQLEATNRSLDTRVGELAQTNVDLFEANRMKSEFLTNVSHELRTPLNAIIGFAELLGSGEQVKREPKMARYVENIQTSARQLLELINDLLDLAKIEAGKLILRSENVNVGDVCEALLNFMKPLAQKKNIGLTLAVNGHIPLVQTDPGRFQQILFNFLSNAVKFTPPDGAVRVAAGLENDALARISVTDTGPGVAPEHQKVIFDKFRQVDGSVTRQHSGTGLGLAISRELASMLGATIELQSALGKGATFSLLIPLAQSRRDPPGSGRGIQLEPMPAVEPVV